MATATTIKVESTKTRAVWADVAKGVCILLVVLWHTLNKHYLQVDWKIGAPIPAMWGFFGDQLMTLRMPLFFTISGMFAVSAFHRPWRQVVRSRVAKFLYLYLVWMLIHTAILWFTPSFDTLSARSLGQFAEQLTITPPNLWYLYALALYFVAAKALHRVPVPILLGAAALLAVVATADLIATPGNRGSLLQNFVFFLLGLHLRPHIERLAQHTNWRRAGAIGAVYAVALLAMAATATQQTPTIWTAVSLIATVFGLSAAPLVARWTHIGAALSWLGRRTLPIYVIHMPILALLHVALIGRLSNASPAVQTVLAVAYPVIVTALLVALCLLAEYGLKAARATWLFELASRRTRV
ncbi:acyltransferase family protein [Acrocarpospora sp. B8E8]|uniref:acyltransferase family protein n=1 Tax=Acrocarpospora sp. B8E8 TaxID=3153572 RepID=UPI00325DDB79